MNLIDVIPGHTYRMGNAVFTVASKRGEGQVTIETLRDKENGIPASMFTRPALTTVEEV